MVSRASPSGERERTGWERHSINSCGGADNVQIFMLYCPAQLLNFQSTIKPEMHNFSLKMKSFTPFSFLSTLLSFQSSLPNEIFQPRETILGMFSKPLLPPPFKTDKEKTPQQKHLHYFHQQTLLPFAKTPQHPGLMTVKCAILRSLRTKTQAYFL